MAFYRKKWTFLRKRRTYRKKAQPSISSLARQVKALKKTVHQVALEPTQYALGGATDLVDDPAVIHLSQYSTWTTLWPSTNTAAHTIKSKMIHKGFKFDMQVSLDNINNEEGEIMVTAFIASVKDAGGSTVLTTPLVNNSDYTMTGGMAYLNPKKFKIHWCRRFTLTGGDGADMQSDNNLKRLFGYIKVNKTVEAVDDNWRDLVGSPDPSDNYYLIVMHDNSSVDLENPRLKYHTVHTVLT